MLTEPNANLCHLSIQRLAKGMDCGLAGMVVPHHGHSGPWKMTREQEENNNIKEVDQDNMTMDLSAQFEENNLVELLRPEQWSEIQASEQSQNTVNPIRRIVDAMQIKPNPDKSLISLHVGDPTVSGILPPHPAVNAAVMDSLLSGAANGYGPAFGLVKARQAVANHVSCPEAPVTADDVILTSGCSHALQLAIEVLANPGSNILIPAPGFPLYQTLSVPLEVQPRNYNLLVERNWEVDLDDLEAQIDNNTAAIIINNPSNPTGAVYSKQHLEAILAIADKHKVPIIADEIYGDMVYDGAVFHPLATLSPKVPILTCDGISKRYLVPGWRLGWLIIHDQPTGTLKQVRECARKLSQKIVGPCVLIQDALPKILEDTPEEFFDNTRQILSENTGIVLSELSDAPGLSPLRANGAMYLMVNVEMTHFPQFKDELEFCKSLIGEESVYCLPGSIFAYPNAIRLVLTYPKEQIREACARIKSFCARNFVPKKQPIVANGYPQHRQAVSQSRGAR